MVDDGQGQQATAWLQSLGLQHLVTQLKMRSLLTMRSLLAADVSTLIEAGCTADEAQVIFYIIFECISSLLTNYHRLLKKQQWF